VTASIVPATPSSLPATPSVVPAEPRLDLTEPSVHSVVPSVNPATPRRLFTREMSLFPVCYRSKSPPIGSMIKEGCTCAGKLIVPDFEKAYSGHLITC
jgi:hypothetical protein